MSTVFLDSSYSMFTFCSLIVSDPLNFRVRSLLVSWSLPFVNTCMLGACFSCPCEPVHNSSFAARKEGVDLFCHI